jgi:hypothetical protein
MSTVSRPESRWSCSCARVAVKEMRQVQRNLESDAGQASFSTTAAHFLPNLDTMDSDRWSLGRDSFDSTYTIPSTATEIRREMNGTSMNNSDANAGQQKSQNRSSASCLFARNDHFSAVDPRPGHLYCHRNGASLHSPMRECAHPRHHWYPGHLGTDRHRHHAFLPHTTLPRCWCRRLDVLASVVRPLKC